MNQDEFDFLEWFFINADFGPADGDVRCDLYDQYEEATGKRVPVGYRMDDDEEEE